jgi:hypothetical protein
VELSGCGEPWGPTAVFPAEHLHPLTVAVLLTDHARTQLAGNEIDLISGTLGSKVYMIAGAIGLVAIITYALDPRSA